MKKKFKIEETKVEQVNRILRDIDSKGYTYGYNPTENCQAVGTYHRHSFDKRNSDLKRNSFSDS